MGSSSLRHALDHCRELRDGQPTLALRLSAASIATMRDARRAAYDVEHDRDDARREFWDRVAAVKKSVSEGEVDDNVDLDGEEGDREDHGCSTYGRACEGGGPSKSTTRTSMERERCPWRRMMLEEYHHHNCDAISEEFADEEDSIILEFKRRVVHRNVPCLLRGLGCGDDALSSPFALVNRMWRRPGGKDEAEGDLVRGNVGGLVGGGIDVDWFLEHVPNYTVPVKTCTPAPISTSLRGTSEGNANLSSGKDDDNDDAGAKALKGVMEDGCTTTTVRDWIEGGGRMDPTSYLKDWHFVRAWEAEGRQRRGEEKGEDEARPPSLYMVPLHFRPDVLNPYLCSFFGALGDRSPSHTTDGDGSGDDCTSEGEGEGEGAGDDYRFVYWGPAGSTTPIHSDVLNTHSWSYNVSGRKRWTFYPPPNSSSAEEDSSFDVVQEGGECMFVPSRWRHSVVNETETLSVNHNWISPCILDRVWYGCLLDEICAIETELDGWGILPLPPKSTSMSAADENGVDDGDGFEEAIRVREDMLLGCAGGMNVSSFYMMVLSASWDHLAEAMKLLTEAEMEESWEDRIDEEEALESGDDAIDGAGDVVADDRDAEGTSLHHLRSPRLWEVSFDLALLGRAMSILLRSDENDGGDDDEGCDVGQVERKEGVATTAGDRSPRHVRVRVMWRLAVGLGSHELANEAAASGRDVVDRIGEFFSAPPTS